MLVRLSLILISVKSILPFGGILGICTLLDNLVVILLLFCYCIGIAIKVNRYTLRGNNLIVVVISKSIS